MPNLVEKVDSKSKGFSKNSLSRYPGGKKRFGRYLTRRKTMSRIKNMLKIRLILVSVKKYRIKGISAAKTRALAFDITARIKKTIDDASDEIPGLPAYCITDLSVRIEKRKLSSSSRFFKLVTTSV